MKRGVTWFLLGWLKTRPPSDMIFLGPKFICAYYHNKNTKSRMSVIKNTFLQRLNCNIITLLIWTAWSSCVSVATNKKLVKWKSRCLAVYTLWRWFFLFLCQLIWAHISCFPKQDDDRELPISPSWGIKTHRSLYLQGRVSIAIFQ